MVGGAQDPVVRERGEGRLPGLEDEPGEDVLGGDGLDLVPELGEPTGDVDADQLEDGDRKADADEPERHLREATTARGIAERQHRRLAHGRFGKLPWKDLVTPAVRLAEVIKRIGRVEDK